MTRTKLARKLFTVFAWAIILLSSRAGASNSNARSSLVSCTTLASSQQPSSNSASSSPTQGTTPDQQSFQILKNRIEELLAKDFLENAQISLSVVDTSNGKSIFNKNPDLVLNPASNIKLITTAAALNALGPGHQFSTVVYIAKDTRIDQTIRGDIYLQGNGDPLLTTGKMFELALKVRAQGIKKITGKVIVDSTRFDHDGLPPGYDQKQENAHYRAPTGATSVNFNTYEVWVSPASKLGSSAIVRTIPPVSGIKIVNKITTVDGQRSKLGAEFEPSKRKLTVTMTGSLGLNAPIQRFRYPIDDPSRYAGEVFRMALTRVGVRVQQRNIDKKSIPDEVVAIALLKSESLADIIRVVNKRSNNFAAEQVLRTLDEGPKSTVRSSLNVVKNYADSIGIPSSGRKIGNGSGLYDNNLISAKQITTLLQHINRDFRYRSDFLSSLPIMGVDGTTRKRLKDSQVAGWIRAKTGTLNGVSALSGYVGAQNQELIAFSCLISGFKKWHLGRVRSVQNQIAEALALFHAGLPLTDPLEPGSESNI